MMIFLILHFHDCKGGFFINILDKLEQLDVYLDRMYSDDCANFDRNLKIGTLQLKLYQLYYAIKSGDKFPDDKIDEILIKVVD